MTRPNILVIMVDQLTGTLFPDGPADWLHTPNLKRLAERSARFETAYCPSPLCGPSRASMMTGQLPSRTGVYDNAAELPASVPTYAHHLRRAGYHTALVGKMHFVGPDQLHGFEERLTTDIYPADFGWTPDYRKPGERIDWWYHNMGSVTGAGVAEISNQMDYDDEVAFRAGQKLYDLAREEEGRPWCVTVSFTHPHDPYVARRRFWDLYEECEHLEPRVPAIPYEEHDAHSKRIYDANDWHRFEIENEHVRRSRRAYFANISYLDEKIGELLDIVERTRQDCAVVFTSDHGDMLGERGLWFKMSPFDGSSRVPFMVAGAGIEAGHVTEPVSTVDLCATLCDLAGIDMGEVTPWTDGHSALPVASGDPRPAPVPFEYCAEGSYAPVVTLRDGRWKYTRCQLDPDQLYDMAEDPDELTNLAADPAHAETLARMRELSEARWDLDLFDSQIRQSQARRWVVYDALRAGRYTPWDHEPETKSSERFMRNHMDLNTVEERRRFPRGE
ncbi:choline-sulfatase [Roseicyclus sp. F158]|uniref:Choline-sulfatase n=1 Tax=Tropicimonas omnivorans TaxID=3075590 RepID=A0ABU3DKY8_9RHOB|nr:choline-sulfatase [Roseicyclus sp. F158]MDT0684384.1 choline-sulfatase [Roseicyclus sp. F158]